MNTVSNCSNTNCHKGVATLIRAKNRGFALIATISVMVLLVMVALAMLSLSTIELRGSGTDQAMVEAQANARVALMMAIGELQKELGPDQRINANAAIRSNSGSIDPAKSRWIGVWDSWKDTQVNRPSSPIFRKWLVSGDMATVSNINAPSTAGGGDQVILATGGRGADEDPYEVMASMVKSETGAYAWWIADETSKAKIGHSKDHDKQPNGLYEHLANMQASPSAEHRVVTKFGAVDRDDERLQKLFTHGSTSLLINDPLNGSALNDSVTVFSKGVLTNVTSGGTKQDLSIFLADDKLARLSGFQLNSTENALYKVSVRGGINFKELHAYYTLPDVLQDTPSGIGAASGGNPADAPMLGFPASAQPSSIRQSIHMSYMRPSLISAGYIMSATAVNGSNGRKNLGLVQDFVITLWNPFDVNIIVRRPTHFTMRVEGLPYDFKIRMGSGGTRWVRPSAAGLNRMAMEFGKTEPIIMRPGEILVLSDASENLRTGGSVIGDILGDVGWRNTGGFVRDLGLLLPNTPTILNIDIEPSQFRGHGGASGGAAVTQFLELIGDNSLQVPRSEWRGGLMVDRMGGPGGTLSANSVGGKAFFPSVSVRPLNTDNLRVGEKVPLGYFALRAKTEADSTVKGRFMSRFNPSVGFYDVQAFDQRTFTTLPIEAVAKEVTSLFDISSMGMDPVTGHGFFGGSYGAANGTSYMITNHIPRIPPMSIAALQHAPANGVQQEVGGVMNRILQPTVNHAIGNSFAVPCINPNSTRGIVNAVFAADHSYLANKALWDNWYFSSLGGQRASKWSEMSEARDVATVYNAVVDGELLPNENMVYVGDGSMAEKLTILSGADYAVDAHMRSAELFLNDGAFNVNSVDVKAWEALLSASRNRMMPSVASGGQARQWLPSQNPTGTMTVSAGGSIVSDDLQTPSDVGNNQWIGFRDLEDDEITQLAGLLVEEIKERGPFLSLSDFVNRRLENSNIKLARMGILQYCLDQTVNDNMASTGPRSSTGRSAAYPEINSNASFPEADDGAISVSSPAYVRQADILSLIGNALTPRSDTFIIRTYGDSRNASGEVVARAYCEAVVQRIPEYVDSVADEPHTKTSSLTSDINRAFGRKYKIVQFKYLTKDEI